MGLGQRMLWLEIRVLMWIFRTKQVSQNGSGVRMCGT